MTDTSTASSVTSLSSPLESGGHDFLPPIRTSSPIQIHHHYETRDTLLEEPFEGYEDVLADYTELPGCYTSSRPPATAVAAEVDRTYYNCRASQLQKPLPDVPQTIFDRLQAPTSFLPTRRAPVPPGLNSWIDRHDEEDAYWSGYAEAVVPVAVRGGGVGGHHGKIEKEIMRMLQFNEEREVERRVMEEKKAGKRKSNFMGFFTGKTGLRRSPSVSTKGMQCGNEFSSKRASYMY